MTIGEYIRFHRIKMNKSQGMLAEEIGVTLQMISRIELGKHSPNLKVAVHLSEALYFSLNELADIVSYGEIQITIKYD